MCTAPTKQQPHPQSTLNLRGKVTLVAFFLHQHIPFHLLFQFWKDNSPMCNYFSLQPLNPLQHDKKGSVEGDV